MTAGTSSSTSSGSGTDADDGSSTVAGGGSSGTDGSSGGTSGGTGSGVPSGSGGSNTGTGDGTVSASSTDTAANTGNTSAGNYGIPGGTFNPYGNLTTYSVGSAFGPSLFGNSSEVYAERDEALAARIIGQVG